MLHRGSLPQNFPARRRLSVMKKSASKKWDALLDEMSSVSQMEHLRYHLAALELFPRMADPDVAPIRREELNKLARVWKLHHQRNFWRTHDSVSKLVTALYEHMLTLPPPTPRKTNSPTAPIPKAVATAPPVSTSERTSALSPSELAKTLGYKGDKFGTRGEYFDGLMYRCRLKVASYDDMLARVGLTSTTDAASAGDAAFKSLTSNKPVDEDSDDARDLQLGSDEVSNNLVGALVHFTGDDSECHAVVIAVGAIPSLVYSWNTTTDEDMKDKIAAALCKLAFKDTAVTLIESGALPVIQSLAHDGDPKILLLAVKTLCLLSSVEENVVAMLFGGVVPTLQAIAESGEMACRVAVAECIRNLVHHEAHRGLVAKGEATGLLLQLLHDPYIATQRCTLLL